MSIQTVPLLSLQPPAANPRSAIDAAALDGLVIDDVRRGVLLETSHRSVLSFEQPWRLRIQARAESGW